MPSRRKLVTVREKEKVHMAVLTKVIYDGDGKMYWANLRDRRPPDKRGGKPRVPLYAIQSAMGKPAVTPSIGAIREVA